MWQTTRSEVHRLRQFNKTANHQSNEEILIGNLKTREDILNHQSELQNRKNHRQTEAKKVRPRLWIKDRIKMLSQVCFVTCANRDLRRPTSFNVHRNNSTGTTHTDSVSRVVNTKSANHSRNNRRKKYSAPQAKDAPSRDHKIRGHLCKQKLRQYWTALLQFHTVNGQLKARPGSTKLNINYKESSLLFNTDCDLWWLIGSIMTQYDSYYNWWD